MAKFDSDKTAKLHQELHSHLPSESALRVKALESLLVKKRLVDPRTIDAWIEAYSEEIGPKRGARIIARSWLDSDFRQRLLTDASAAIDEMGFLGNATAHLKVVENTQSTHNLVVCTLCSCYPFSILGVAPAWYKAAAYRSRAVRDPRGVLSEFGINLESDCQINVWDSTAELRYLVIPERPAGTENFDEDELTEIVTRNSMIGTDRDLASVRKGDI